MRNSSRPFWLIPIAFSIGCVDLSTPWEKTRQAVDAGCAGGYPGCAVVKPIGGNGGVRAGGSDLDGSTDIPARDDEPRDASVGGSTQAVSPDGSPDARGVAGRTAAPGSAGSSGIGGSSVNQDAAAAGTMGLAGIAGTGGMGGSSGRSTGGADAGGSTTAGCQELADCAPTKVCNSGSCMAPQGLVVLSVPLTTNGQNQRHAYPFSPAANLTDKTITLRVYAPGATAGLLNIYLSMANATSTAGSGALVPLVNYSSAWKDITFNVGGAMEAFDPSQIKQLTIEVQSKDLGTWKNPTVIYIDSIVISTLTLGSTFDSSLGGFSQSSTQAVPGSTLTWSSVLP
jgi:hypothetical protein